MNDFCTTCNEPYSRPPTTRASLCNNSFHCCRTCEWKDGRRIKICQQCQDTERPTKRHAGSGWATNHIQRLIIGETVQFRPHGNSMSGKVESGQLCTVVPITGLPTVGQIVLCRVAGKQYLHLVTAVKDGRAQISNNKKFVNGWVHPEAIYGVLVKVED